VNPERWRQINDLFHAALEGDPASRQRLLTDAAARDPELAAEVHSLLAAHEADHALLDRPAWEAAPDLILDPSSVSLTGAHVGPYVVLKEIGRGGMGIVYEAEDTRLGRTIALKALAPEYATDPLRRQRLTREARAAAALAHPSIATVYALEEIDGSLFLASELVRGETLRDELRRGPLPPDRLLPTLLELASGLAAAHAAGIVHRDLKPENIVRCPDGRVKILDFGIARMTNPDSVTELRITQAGFAMGTPGYMPPEQLQGNDAGPRTDVFAFGVVGWELATGAHPFGANAAELLARMSDLLERSPGTAIEAAIPVRGLAAVLRRCMRPDPADRYGSAQDIVTELDRIRQAWTTPPVNTAADADALWWWQFHQVLLSAVMASMPVAAWFVRRWSPGAGSRIFLAVLALSTISVTIRLNLLFTSRVHHSRLQGQRRRVYAALVIAELLLGGLLLLAAALVTGPHDALAAVLVTLAVATIASLGIVEPATTAAAGLQRPQEE
jgi:serine/threonine protein kinase